MDYSSGSGVVATQTAVLYLPRGRCRCLRRCLCLVVKAAEGIGWGGDLSGFICQADTAAELWPRSWRNRRAVLRARWHDGSGTVTTAKSKITPVV